MDELMFSLCCLSNRGLLCGSLSKELQLDGGMLTGCKIIVMNCCLMNKRKRSGMCLPSHTYMLLS